MRHFIKISAVCLTIVIAFVVYQQAFESTLVQVRVPIAEEALLNTTPIEIVRSKPSMPVPPQQKPKIYRRFDENGRVVFTDRPINESEQLHPLVEIGYVGTSGEIKQRIAADRRKVADLNAINYASNVEQISQASSESKQEYKFSNTHAGQKHKYILISGRITDGSSCKDLRVTAVAKSDGGRFVRGTDNVSTNGFGSSLFEIKIPSSWNGQGRRPQWEVVDVTAGCLIPF